jgi:hypothetical protein
LKEKIMDPTRHTFVYIPPTVPTQTIEILVNRGTVSAIPNGGALRTNCRQVVQWICAQQFTITFTQLGGSAQPWGPLHAVQEGQSWVVTTEPKSYPEGATGPFYEYTIQVGDLQLDPIVIVDR